MPSVHLATAPDTRTPRPSGAARLRRLHADAAQRFRTKLHIPSKSHADRFLSDLSKGQHTMSATEAMVALSAACPDDADAFAWVDAVRAEIAARRELEIIEAPLAELHDAQDRADAEFDMAQRRAMARPDCPLALERLEEAARLQIIRTQAVVIAERASRERRRPRTGATPQSSLMRGEDSASSDLRAIARGRFPTLRPAS